MIIICLFKAAFPIVCCGRRLRLMHYPMMTASIIIENEILICLVNRLFVVVHTGLMCSFVPLTLRLKCYLILSDVKESAMCCSLQDMMMQFVLRRGIEYRHLSPHAIVGNLNEFFFERMFVNMVNRCYNLTVDLFLDSNPDDLDISGDSDATEESMLELMSIMKTFASVGREGRVIQAVERLETATLDLISITDCLVDVVPPEVFNGYLRFLECTIVLFVDASFTLPSLNDYALPHVLYHIRHVRNV